MHSIHLGLVQSSFLLCSGATSFHARHRGSPHFKARRKVMPVRTLLRILRLILGFTARLVVDGLRREGFYIFGGAFLMFDMTILFSSLLIRARIPRRQVDRHLARRRNRHACDSRGHPNHPSGRFHPQKLAAERPIGRERTTRESPRNRTTEQMRERRVRQQPRFPARPDRMNGPEGFAWPNLCDEPWI